MFVFGDGATRVGDKRKERWANQMLRLKCCTRNLVQFLFNLALGPLRSRAKGHDRETFIIVCHVRIHVDFSFKLIFVDP